MGRLNVFNFITLDGYYKGPDEDISWHRHGAEEGGFANENLASAGSTLLFGRVTYNMMAGFWPSPMASERDPVMAQGMNNAEKVVFSRTLQTADWNNTRLVQDNMVEEVRKMKQIPGKSLTILGSGSIVTQLADHGLIDDYQIMLDPVAIGQGTPIFKGLRNRLNLQLVDSRIFKSGVILLSYQPLP